MKIKPEDYAELERLVAPFMEEAKKAEYNAAGMTDKRYYFDCFWTASRARRADAYALMQRIYAYANDDHLATALKHVYMAKYPVKK